MKTIEEYEVRMPCWALSYIINNDASGLNDEEIQMVDSWVDSFKLEPGQSIIFGSAEPEGEPYFTSNPEFGLACDCEDYHVLIVA